MPQRVRYDTQPSQSVSTFQQVKEELNLCLNAKRVFNVISSFAVQNILNQLDETPNILFPRFLSSRKLQLVISDLISESVMGPQPHLVVSPGIVKRRVSGTVGLYICAYQARSHIRPKWCLSPCPFYLLLKSALFVCFLNE